MSTSREGFQSVRDHQSITSSRPLSPRWPRWSTVREKQRTRAFKRTRKENLAVGRLVLELKGARHHAHLSSDFSSEDKNRTLIYGVTSSDPYYFFSEKTAPCF